MIYQFVRHIDEGGLTILAMYGAEGYDHAYMCTVWEQFQATVEGKGEEEIEQLFVIYAEEHGLWLNPVKSVIINDED